MKSIHPVLSKSVFIVEEEATDLTARIIKNNESPLKLYTSRSGHVKKQAKESWTHRYIFPLTIFENMNLSPNFIIVY